MKLELETGNISDYLAETVAVDLNHPDVALLAARLSGAAASNTDLIKRAYEFVRDEIAHSADIQGKTVTFSASDVLGAGEGICFAKSNLLAALLRRNNVPTGFCYQLLRLDGINTPLVLHGLNAVYIAENSRWIRLDARGNKPGVNAQYCDNEEMLAFLPNLEHGEADYNMIFTAPRPIIARIFSEYKAFEDLWAHLPGSLT